jgi:hypothetical protein
MAHKYTPEDVTELLTVGTYECWGNLVYPIPLVYSGHSEILLALELCHALLHFLIAVISPG